MKFCSLNTILEKNRSERKTIENETWWWKGRRREKTEIGLKIWNKKKSNKPNGHGRVRKQNFICKTMSKMQLVILAHSIVQNGNCIHCRQNRTVSTCISLHQTTHPTTNVHIHIKFYARVVKLECKHSNEL